MATTTVRLSHAARFTLWFPDFLRKELAPYPGRGAIVARMVISATITAILIVTFRIPGGAIGALCAFILSRENLLSTAKSALYIVLAFVLGALFIPIGARFFASVPITHFLWEGVSLFLVFFLLRTMTNYAVATGLSLVATNVLSIWYLPGPAERNVELTLWQVAAASVGALVTLAVEILFHAFHRGDEVADGLEVRMQQIEALMESYAGDRPPPAENVHMLAQYAVVGMGGLRRYIARSNSEPAARARISALVSVMGRSIDFAAALSGTVQELPAEERERAGQLARRIATVRQSFAGNTRLPSWGPMPESRAGTPLLSELEAMVSLIPSVLDSESTIDPRLEVLEGPPARSRLFVDDAFSNPEHLRYVLAGTMAAMLCYILYVSLAWPGISTSVTTCVLTGLTNVGASRQKQVLRLAGAILGGFVFGMGAQIFVLPNIDSISGFVVLFATVSAVAAWIGTSSARLSYAGLQIALAFYLINLSEFSIQTSLSVARDRAIGVLLGTTMMWLIFERFYPRPASDEMVRLFIRNLRLMADLITTSNAGADAQEIVEIRRKRDQIYRNFGDVNAQADAVPFETGPARASHMAARDRIRRWQTTLRTFYLMEAPLIQFRVFGDISQRLRPFAHIEDGFRVECARAFQTMAECLENQLNNRPYNMTPRALLQPPGGSGQEEQAMFSEREEALMRMTRTIASLVERMEHEVASEPLYATE